jgi:cellobiose phosphorylase
MPRSGYEKLFKNKYGHFSEDGTEYVVVRPDTPRPWSNVISNRNYSMTVSQTGGGFSWMENSNLNRLTRWDQDLIRDDWGKYLYLRDDTSRKFWSLSYKPTCDTFDTYRCRHGLGYTVFETARDGIEAKWTQFIPLKDTCEVWVVELENKTSRDRKLSLFTYMEWLLGVWPDSHREFHKLFIDTRFDGLHDVIYATKRLWTVPNEDGESWNQDWPYTAFHATDHRVRRFDTDKENFMGRNGSLVSPKALVDGKLKKGQGSWGDAIASLQVQVNLKAHSKKTVVFITGAAPDEQMARDMIFHYRDPQKALAALEEVKSFWRETVSGNWVETPDPSFNLLTNVWLKYQAISARIWGRAAYYQSSGAFGYRDQLQDSQLFLPLDPEKTKRQILLHASRQFESGIVQHWWHPSTGEGPTSHFSDDLLWLPFVLVHYLKETADFNLLQEEVPFLKDGNHRETGSLATVKEHCLRAIAKSLSRFSKRGLPLIGEGDWNDGLSSCGDKWKGESVWVGHFLYGILNDFAEVLDRTHDPKRAAGFRLEAKKIYKDVNEVGWDGNWYFRATTDKGDVLGSSKCKEGKIFLNAQTWAIINGVVPAERLGKITQSLEKYLYRDYGPILFYPAYSKADKEIGYLTRYPAGCRENGGLYTHAGVWAVQAECVLKRPEKAYALYKSFQPIRRGADPERYYCEPYVTPGNVDGPDSPNYGRGGWTWYTGSAAWLFRISVDWILGVRATYEGLLVDPCIPKEWDGFRTKRKFRGATYDIKVTRKSKTAHSVRAMIVDGKKIQGNLIKPFNDHRAHTVEIELV